MRSTVLPVVLLVLAVSASAAEALAELGNDAGVSVLVGMLERRRHPASGEGPDGAAVVARIMLEEKIRVCGHLARLRAKDALPALKKGARSDDESLAAAARSAIEAIGGE